MNGGAALKDKLHHPTSGSEHINQSNKMRKGEWKEIITGLKKKDKHQVGTNIIKI